MSGKVLAPYLSPLEGGATRAVAKNADVGDSGPERPDKGSEKPL